MADVAFAFVHDFGAREQWWARRGEGAWRDGALLDPTLPERRSRDGRLELLGIESSDPQWVRGRDRAADGGHAAGCARWARSPRRCARSPRPALTGWSRCSAAAASTPPPASSSCARPAASSASPSLDDPLDAPLDATPSSHLVAARSAQTLRELEAIRR